MSGRVIASSTHVCVLTAAGRSAVAVVAVVGPEAVASIDHYFRAANGRALPEQPLSRIVFGRWGGATGEELIVCRRNAEEVEIHCHGGSQTVTRIVEHLTKFGCVSIDWQEWLARRSQCSLTTEAHIALSQASTLRTASILLDQYHGALRREVDAICAALREGAAEIACDQLQFLLQHAKVGLHLTEPWKVVIAGRPNVGKSSLINALMGYPRALVYDQPGTTRDVVSATTAIEGWPVRLSDTAGLHQGADALETAGIALAHGQLKSAELVVWVLDASRIDENTTLSLQEMAWEQSREVEAALDWSRTLIVVNKIDLVRVPAEFGEQGIATCATSGEGVENLIRSIADRLVPQSPPPGSAVPFAQRQVALLNQALTQCRQNDPAAAAEVLVRLLRGLPRST